MSLRIVVLLAALALTIAGAELLRQSAAMPEWINENKAEAVQRWDPPLEDTGAATEAYNARWVRAINRLRTEKWPYHDAGMALVAFGLSLAAGLLALRISSLADIKALQTPKRPLTIFALALLGWFLYWGSAAAALVEGTDRSEYPPWVDSQMLQIAFFGVFAVIGAVVMGAVALLVLRKTILPVSLWVWRKDMPGHDWFYTIGTGVMMLVALEVLRETYLFGHWLAVPAVFLSVYATLAFRAAGISKNV